MLMMLMRRVNKSDFVLTAVNDKSVKLGFAVTCDRYPSSQKED